MSGLRLVPVEGWAPCLSMTWLGSWTRTEELMRHCRPAWVLDCLTGRRSVAKPSCQIMHATVFKDGVQGGPLTGMHCTWAASHHI